MLCGISPKLAKTALLFDQNEAQRRWRLGLNVFEAYAEEVLLQAGIPFRTIASVEEVSQSEFDLVVVALAGEDELTAERLLAYMEQGGIVVAIANMNRLAKRFGYMQAPRIDCGYARFGDKYAKAEVIRFLGAIPWQQNAAEQLPGEFALEETFGIMEREKPGGASAGAALLRLQVGAGRLERWAIDICGTTVRMQQGAAPVLADGAPAPDGSAPVDDGLLKADDGSAMDWTYDRAATETGVPYFPHPYVDYWRELLANRLIGLALDRGMTLPVVAYWPAGIERVAMLSHDSDLNGDANADATLRLLDECEVQSTWCMIEEGYSKEMYNRISEAGHELALHFNALESDGGRWFEDEFARQLHWFIEATGLPGAVSNKNHFTRFEGWGELFEWLEKYGVESDQTRGPSKKGNVGMLFGTCHPYYPIAWLTERNRIYNVVEIGFMTQDLDLSERWPDSSVIVPFLGLAQSVEGVAHFLVHQVHIGHQESVRMSLRRIVHEARTRQFTFMTGKQINDWLRVRRAYVAGLYDQLGSLLQGMSDEPAGDSAQRPVVWLPGMHIDDESRDYREKFGHWCLQIDSPGYAQRK